MNLFFELLKEDIDGIINTHEQLDYIQGNLYHKFKEKATKEELEEFSSELYELGLLAHLGLVQMKKSFDFYSRWIHEKKEKIKTEEPEVRKFLTWLRIEFDNSLRPMSSYSDSDMENIFESGDWKLFYKEKDDEKSKRKIKKTNKPT